MAETYKVLAQANPDAGTLTTLYTVPSGTAVVVSTLVVCNQSAFTITYRVAVAVAAATDTAKQYLVYDASLKANSSDTLTFGVSMAATDVMRVYAGNGSVSFNLFGVEVT